MSSSPVPPRHPVKAITSRLSIAERHLRRIQNARNVPAFDAARRAWERWRDEQVLSDAAVARDGLAFRDGLAAIPEMVVQLHRGEQDATLLEHVSDLWLRVQTWGVGRIITLHAFASGHDRSDVEALVRELNSLGMYLEHCLVRLGFDPPQFDQRLDLLSPVPLPDLRPDRHEPPESNIVAAMRDIPVALTDSRFGGPKPFLPATPGECELLYPAWLAFAQLRGHRRTAAEWAIYRLAEAERVNVVWPSEYQQMTGEQVHWWIEENARLLRGDRSPTVADWDLGEGGRILAIRSTPALWRWDQSGCPADPLEIVLPAGSPAEVTTPAVETPGRSGNVPAGDESRGLLDQPSAPSLPAQPPLPTRPSTGEQTAPPPDSIPPAVGPGVQEIRGDAVGVGCVQSHNPLPAQAPTNGAAGDSLQGAGKAEGLDPLASPPALASDQDKLEPDQFEQPDDPYHAAIIEVIIIVAKAHRRWPMTQAIFDEMVRRNHSTSDGLSKLGKALAKMSNGPDKVLENQRAKKGYRVINYPNPWEPKGA